MIEEPGLLFKCDIFADIPPIHSCGNNSLSYYSSRSFQCEICPFPFIHMNAVCNPKIRCGMGEVSTIVGGVEICVCKYGHGTDMYGSCQKSDVGKYINVLRSVPCTNCPGVTTTREQGSTHIKDCNVCPRNYFMNMDSQLCDPCPSCTHIDYDQHQETQCFACEYKDITRGTNQMCLNVACLLQMKSIQDIHNKVKKTLYTTFIICNGDFDCVLYPETSYSIIHPSIGIDENSRGVYEKADVDLVYLEAERNKIRKQFANRNVEEKYKYRGLIYYHKSYYSLHLKCVNNLKDNMQDMYKGGFLDVG